MKFVVEYQEGDGYTYCCTTTVPVEAESKEAIANELKRMAQKMISDIKAKNPEARNGVYRCGNSVIYINSLIEDLKYCEPRIMTVDEWFEFNGIE